MIAFKDYSCNVIAVIKIKQRFAGTRVTHQQNARYKMTIESVYRIGFC